MLDHLLWAEKYRPHIVKDCILPDHLQQTFSAYVSQKQIPNLILSGGPGVGKTTVAKAMCDEIGADYIVINGSSERGIDITRQKITEFASAMSFTGGRKVIIIDEADGLTPDAQNAMKATIEFFSDNCSFVFTCNHKAKIIEPIHSRCAVIEFNLMDSAAVAGRFYNHALDILRAEKITYEAPVVTEIVLRYLPDYRRTLNELQRLGASGHIGVGALVTVRDVPLKELASFLKARDFGKMRRWAAQNVDLDIAKIYRRIYDSLYDYLDEGSIPQAVVILADYQYKNAFVADPELNLVACLTQIMIDCKFK